MSRHLKNKVLIITGASSGIGRATAIAAAAQGMNIVVSARREDRLKDLVNEIQKSGGQASASALAIPCDVTNQGQVQSLIDQTMNRLGRLDAFYANAGYGLYETIERTTLPMLRDIFETNFFGTIHCINAALPAIRQTLKDYPSPPDQPDQPDSALAHLLICSSALSEIAIPMDGAYAATKAAQDSIACALRAELSIERIHVTSIHPIGTATEFSKQAQGSTAAASFMHAQSKSWQSHTPQQVAKPIIRALKRPRAEVWPSTLSRFMLAFATAFPNLAAKGIARMMKSNPSQ